MSEEIQNLLIASSKEGVLESEGSFSIDLERARAKSHRFGAENQDKALLKLMMAVLATGPAQVDAKLCSEKLTFQINGAEGLLSDARTLGGDLGEALWSCHYSGFGKIACLLRGQCLQIDHEGISQNEDRSFEAHGTVYLELHYEKGNSGIWESMKSLVRGRGRSAFAFHHDLCYSPIPITLDTRPVNCPTLAPSQKTALQLFLTGSEHTRTAEICSVAQRACRAKHSYLKDRHFSDEGAWGTFCKFQRPASKKPFGLTSESWLTVRENSLLAHLWVPLDSAPVLFGQSGGSNRRLLLVRHGVIVGECPFPVPGVASAHGLDTDLTGLQIVDNAKLRQLQTYLRDALERCYRKTLDLKPSGSVQKAIQRYPLT